jgi:hypothetical protein
MKHTDRFQFWRALGLNCRAANCLTACGITTVEQAKRTDDRTLHEAFHVGPGTLRQIRQVAPYRPSDGPSHD